MPLIGDHQNLPYLFRSGDNLMCVLDRADHRLLSQHVQPLVERRHDLLKVQSVRRGNFHRVHLNLIQHLAIIRKDCYVGDVRILLPVALPHPLNTGFAHIA